ncbi:unannotated protein [freshwater metagenome]|uniref:Unannotated protein n=1 Tax=freshwater metagenome TaxID=449393 RepID=A0A6J6SHL4_9ZZZZ|nr:hypothetical protein [Actinomycetota bacterium]
MRALPTLLAALPLVVATGCSDGGLTGPDRRLADGEVVVALGSPPGRAVTLVTPAGRMTFVVGPATEATAYERDPAQSIGAPDDGELVGIAFRLDIGTSFDGMRQVPGSEPVLPRVSLVADGETYPLDAFEDELPTRADLWVGVPSAEDLAIEVEFDGVVQRAELDGTSVASLGGAGLAAPLYTQAEQLAPATVSCGTPTVDGEPVVPRTAGCRVEVARVPWLATTGWVETPEQSWLVLRPRVNVGSFEVGSGEDRTSCGVYDTRAVTYVLDGEEPVSVTPLPGEDEPGSGEEVVFAVDGAQGSYELEVTATGTGGVERPGCPGSQELTWRTRLY